MGFFRSTAEVGVPCDPPPDVAPDWYGRFMSKIERPNGIRGCWNWTYPKNEHGYGIFFFKRNLTFAHRWSFTQCCGKIPEGLSVLHMCDNPSCINPLHLRLGTQRDNNRDRDRKNRVRHGERHPRAKFTEQQIRDVRAEIGDVDQLITKITAIAKRHNVIPMTIYKIISRQTWRRT